MRYIKFIYIFFLYACANIAMPTGGPRDITPPEMVSSNPASNELNFSGKIIELTFNEDIKLKDPKEEILIVPTVGKNTTYKVKKKTLFIEPELGLLPNTTYSISFRDGVQDITEGNPAENMRLAFSTGPDIDSLSINGRIKSMFSEKIPEKITIALYQTDTFDIFKHSPTYFTKSDKNGVFSLPNLKSDTYFIYAFDDKNKNLKVDSKTEKNGFLITSIEPLITQDSLEIPLILVDSRPLTLNTIRHTDKASRVRFNKQPDLLTIKGISTEQSIYSYGSDRTELIFYHSIKKGDSLKVQLSATDSVEYRIDTLIYIKSAEIKTIPESFKTTEISQRYNVPTKTYSYTFKYNKPIASINTDSIYIRYDSITTKTLEPINIKIDTINNEITLHSLVEEIKQEEKKKSQQLQFIIAKGAIISIDADTLRTITRTIRTFKEDDLGMVAIKVETKQKNFIVQLTTSDDQIVQSIGSTKEFTFKYLEPIEYKIRVIVDTNNNGKWDAGNFHQSREPEKIVLYKSEEGKYSFPIRANWEYGPLLIKF